MCEGVFGNCIECGKPFDLSPKERHYSARCKECAIEVNRRRARERGRKVYIPKGQTAESQTAQLRCKICGKTFEHTGKHPKKKKLCPVCEKSSLKLSVNGKRLREALILFGQRLAMSRESHRKEG